MLLAYLDEIGEPGAFISKSHPKFKTSPSFGYAGFVVPESSARDFGALFVRAKRQLSVPKTGETKGEQFEIKGSDMFRPKTHEQNPQNIRVFLSLVKSLRAIGGELFYYSDEKALGTTKQTGVSPEDREMAAMKETVNRLCTHASRNSENILLMIDQVNENQRKERVARLYAHVFSRSSERDEMRLIVEPPMHIDSTLSSNIQFADWVAAVMSRAIDFQLIDESPYTAIVKKMAGPLQGAFTNESKLHLNQKSIGDLNHSALFGKRIPSKLGNVTNNPENRAKLEKIYRASQGRSEVRKDF